MERRRIYSSLIAQIALSVLRAAFLADRRLVAYLRGAKRPILGPR